MSTKTSSVRARVLTGLGLGLLLLTGVGIVSGQEAAEDQNATLGDAKCLFCHKDHRETFPKSIHAGLGGEEDSVSCEACHGPGGKHLESGGEVEFIVRYGELDAGEASRRCLSCHGRTAEKGGHVDGFMESRWFAKGLSCTSCHQAHAPQVEKAPAKKATAAKFTGEATCLVCHSDYREYSHRPQVADALGCESCHGPGRAHVDARGDASLIRSPAKLEAPASDRSCVMCHSDMTAPDHFKPEPGKTRCVDCHTIHHAPEAVAEAAEADETPGVPAFRLDATDGEAPAPEVAGNQFRLSSSGPSAGVEDGEKQSFAGLTGSGHVRFGGRFTNVVGNEEMYEQDIDLDSGFVLFDFDLEASLEKDPAMKLRAFGEGTGGPSEHYLLDFRREGSWSFVTTFDRIQSTYAASGDPRDWGATRRNLAAALTVLPGSDFRVTLGLDARDREGEFRGTVLSAGATLNGSEPFDESGLYGYLRVEWGTGPLLLSLTQGFRREELESGTDAGRLQVPTDRSFVSEQETDVSGPMTIFLAEWDASENLTLDGRFVWAPFEVETTYDATTTGPGGGAGYVERTTGEVDGEKDHLRGEIGATWVPAEDWTFLAGMEGYLADQESDGDFSTGREEPPATPPVVTARTESESTEHRRLRARAEAHWQMNDWLGLLGGFEYVTETYEFEENGRRSDHDGIITGPVVGFDMQPAKGVDVDFLYRFTQVSDPFTEIGAKDVDNARLRARWQATEEWKFTGYARRSLLTNPKHDTSVHSWGAGLGALWTPFEELEVDAAWNAMRHDSETEVVRYIGGVPEVGLSEYYAQTMGGHLGFLWRLTTEFRIRGRLMNVATTGDYETAWLDMFLGAEYDVLRNLTLGLDGRYVRYNETDSDVDDYTAWIMEFWLRVGF
ncbi:MAG: cytochrome c3 family protein [Planctomycetota bacterium]